MCVCEMNPVKTCYFPLRIRMMCVHRMCTLCATYAFPCSFGLTDGPCLLQGELYSHDSGTRTLGFCFSCQSNRVNADAPMLVSP